MNEKSRPTLRGGSRDDGRLIPAPDPVNDITADQAGWYAENGWPVLPVMGKVPLIREWTTNATSDPTKVAFWWVEWPGANIGLLTGHAFDVLDVDDVEAFKAAMPPGVSFPTGPVVVTGGGGLHIYFRATGMGCRTRFMPGADWRGKGGYVVAPPSIHPNGQPYVWKRGPATPIPAAPGWLMGQLRPPSPPTRLRAPQGPYTGAQRQRPGYGHAALVREARRLARATEGTRNDCLNTSAYRMGQLVAAGLLDATTVGDVLVNVAVGVGLGEREAVATFTSGFTAGQRCPRGAA